MKQQINLRAWEGRPCVLDPRVAAEIQESGLATVTLGAQGAYRVVAKSLVGVASGPDWEVRVSSHLDVRQLMFLLCYARDPRGWKDVVSEFDVEQDLHSAVANAFSSLAERAFRRGMLRGYRRVEERSSVLRGRLRVAAQVAHGGLPSPVELERDEYDTDTDENRLVLAALRLLERQPGLQTHALKRVRRLVNQLDGVRYIRDPRHLAVPRITRLNQHYRSVLLLADVVFNRSTPTLRQGPVAATTFAFELHRVFEDFLKVALAVELRPYEARVASQVTGRALDDGGALTLRPDFVVDCADRSRTILDAKFKRLDDGLTGDAYQMLAYLLEFRARRGYLIAVEGGAADYEIGSAQKVISVRTIDLSRAPDNVLRSVARLACEVAGSSG